MRLGYGITILLLTVLAALGMLSTNIYLPAMPVIGQALHADAAGVQLTLTVYLAAFAAAQLIVGPLSDRYGRRPVLLAGLVLFIAGTAACLLAAGIATMIGGRMLQALGACAASVVGRAMARDLFEGAALGKALGLIMTGVAVAPGFGPLLGGVLQEAFGWRSAFAFVALVGAAVLAAVLAGISETRPAATVRPTAATIAGGYGLLLSTGAFLIPALATTAAIGALFAFFAASPAVFIEAFGLSPIGYGLVSAGTVFGVFAGGYAAPRLMRRAGAMPSIRIGLILVLGGAALLWLADRNGGDLAGAILALLVFLFGMGIVNPLAVAAALQPFPQRAGAASALIGALQMAGAAAGAALVSLLPLPAIEAMPAAMFAAALLGLIGAIRQPAAAAQTA
ncbi:MAG TPA: multidrug effflux MFS transporter [Alphaproteobacteria bacterium]